jgi:hypothetical protein
MGLCIQMIVLYWPVEEEALKSQIPHLISICPKDMLYQN